jgi:hypothetical protein
MNEMSELESIEYEQYALVNYLLNANPGPVLAEAAEVRIKELEKLKNRDYGIGKRPVTSIGNNKSDNFYLRNNITFS